MEYYLICLAAALIGGLMLSRLTKLMKLPAVTAYLVAGLLMLAVAIDDAVGLLLGVVYIISRSTGKYLGAYGSCKYCKCSAPCRRN